MELLWAEGNNVKRIEKVFENRQLKKLVILGSLQYIGARMCLAITELLLTRESMMWKTSFVLNRNHVMRTPTRQDMK
jgi:hypothetical protein